MKYAFGLAALAAVATASPTGLTKRNINDIDILNYALTLEHLEDNFYRGGLQHFNEQAFLDAGYTSTFYNNLKEVSADETTHVAFLTSALGVHAVKECTYKFPYHDVNSFIGLASVLEGVGVSAYLGAAASIAEKAYLTAAGSILTVEARHSSYLRAAEKESPFPYPFDTPLDFDEVYTLASAFIVSCPTSNGKLPFKTFPSLSLATAGTIHPGQTIRINSPHISGSTIYAAFLSVTGPVYAKATHVVGGYTVQVPSTGIVGQSYLVLQNCNTGVTDSSIQAGPLIFEVTK